jgi:hypothetical protein
MEKDIQSNLDIVMYALGRLNGSTQKISTERIAHESFKLTPDRFSWILQEYRHIPDKYVAKTTLEDAAKKKYGALVQGQYARDQSRDGWTLTPAGVRWLEQNGERIAKALGQVTAHKPKLSPLEVKRFKSRMAKDRAFRIFATTGSVNEVSHYMLADMLQASPDARHDVLRHKFDHLQSTAQLAADNDILAFLHACRAHFSNLLESEEGDPYA